MANPMIDRPLRTIDFPVSSRVSPLGFGFARHAGPFASSPFKGSSGNAGPSHDWTTQSPLTSSRRPVSPRRPRNSLELSSPPPPTLKRTRRSSSVSSSSTTVSVRPSNDPLSGDAERPIDVHGLVLKERSRKSLAPPRHVKRIRNVSVNAGITDTDVPVDVGLLLSEPICRHVAPETYAAAAIPLSDHLSILTSLLRDDPSLSAKILDRLPHPELGECERQVDKLLDAVKRAAGPVTFTGTSQRAWTRAEKDILGFHRTVRAAPSSHSALIMAGPHVLDIFQLLPSRSAASRLADPPISASYHH